MHVFHDCWLEDQKIYFLCLFWLIKSFLRLLWLRNQIWFTWKKKKKRISVWIRLDWSSLSKREPEKKHWKSQYMYFTLRLQTRFFSVKSLDDWWCCQYWLQFADSSLNVITRGQTVLRALLFLKINMAWIGLEHEHAYWFISLRGGSSALLQITFRFEGWVKWESI